MGHLAAWPVDRWQRDFGLVHFVETGTWRGDGLARGLTAGFRTCTSIEANGELALAARDRFANNPRAEVLNADSAAGLAKLLPWIEEGPALFWLDAHLPQRYAGSPDVATFPLEAELRLICGQRDTSGDVFLMDDLRIYEDGPFRAGPYTLDIPRPAGGAGFVTELLGATHEVTKSHLDEGYILSLPSRAKRYQ